MKVLSKRVTMQSISKLPLYILQTQNIDCLEKLLYILHEIDILRRVDLCVLCEPFPISVLTSMLMGRNATQQRQFSKYFNEPFLI